jgi:carbonic anhydrase
MTAAARSTPYGYGPDDGPARWASLDEAYRECGEGRQQSPIDLSGGIAAELPSLELSYAPAPVSLENNGHTVQASYRAGSATMRLAERRSELRQLHFHAPSEHTVEARSFPVELHFVYEDEQGGLTVVAVLVEEGEANPGFDRLLDAIRGLKPGEVASLAEGLDPADLMPVAALDARWSYRGSLTTPPCTEGVSWEVVKQPVALSADQIGAFTSLYEGTNRPVQPLNGRQLLVTPADSVDRPAASRSQ